MSRALFFLPAIVQSKPFGWFARYLDAKRILKAFVATSQSICHHVMTTESSLFAVASPTTKDHCALEDGSWVSSRGSIFPTLYTYIMHEGEFRPIDPNSSPVPFKNEIFEGVAALYVPTDDSTNSSVFNNNPLTTFEIQVQGRFLSKPKGRLYMTGEITQTMSLNIFTTYFCEKILQFLQSKHPALRYAFGDIGGKVLPHVGLPMTKAAEVIIVTRGDEKIPEIGSYLPDNIIGRTYLNDPDDLDIDLDAVYTIVVRVQNINVRDWTLDNIPLLGQLNMLNFWGKSDLRLCCYSADSDQLSHTQQDNNYCFSMELKNVTNHATYPLNDGVYDPQSNQRRIIKTSD